jgi:hypothetical protein
MASMMEHVVDKLYRQPGLSRQDVRVVRVSARIPLYDDHTDHQLFPVNGLSISAPGYLWFAFAPNRGSIKISI